MDFGCFPSNFAILQVSFVFNPVTTTFDAWIKTSNLSPLAFSFLIPSIAILLVAVETLATLPSTSLYSPLTTFIVQLIVLKVIS